MKFLSLLTFFFIFSIQSNGQVDTSIKKEESNIFITYEIFPKYKYGTNLDLTKDIYKKLGLTMKGRSKGDEILVLSFEVDSLGKVDCPEIVYGSMPEVEEKLLDLIWEYEFEAGTFRGVPVKCQMNFPFRITRQEE